MVKKIRWSKNAVADRIQILDYWNKRIGNKKYSTRLDKELRAIIKMLSKFPETGRKLDNREERFFVKNCYQIFYIVSKTTVDILHIWDSRRNPQDLDLLN
jgi:plasmid stabilization system protein ParE